MLDMSAAVSVAGKQIVLLSRGLTTSEFSRMNFTSSSLGGVALDLLLVAVRPRKPVAVVVVRREFP